MKIKEKIFVSCAIVVILVIIIIGIVNITNKIIGYIEKETCYNMPLNEFYETPKCLKYKEANND